MAASITLSDRRCGCRPWLQDWRRRFEHRRRDFRKMKNSARRETLS
jgi:hypothetical protein